ncbi:DUF4158 domain-containing protein [Streptomyces sp. NPDC056835]|uniref:DUF4158 domain-containing protein n=1 Tax=Streptomyces sp. NPDC056835 TaxID=3345956 RepID=UPI00368E593A
MERTAYPRFKRIISGREPAQFFTPCAVEVAWAGKRTHDRPERMLTLLVLLKRCARLGCFPDLEQVPGPVVDRVRGTISVSPDTPVAFHSERSAERYRSWTVSTWAWRTTRCGRVGLPLPRWRRRPLSGPRWWTW